MITRKMIKRSDLNEWLEFVDDMLRDTWGLNRDFAMKVSLFLLYSSIFGNGWTINSGFRDPKKQNAMRVAWDRGDRGGMIVRPALRSKHSITGWLGSPNSQAIDIRFKDPAIAGNWSRFFGLKWGGNFNSPDPVHFYL